MGKGLTREILISKALEIVDRDGLDALSMRRLGAELGVDPMAAYRHFPNKTALLDGVVEAMMAQVDLTIDKTKSWQDQIRQLTEASLKALVLHPHAVSLLTDRPLRTVESLKIIESGLEILAGAEVPLYYASLTINVIGLLATMIALEGKGQSPTGVDVNRPKVSGVDESLPREELPLLFQATDMGQTARTYDEILEFAVDALLCKLEHVRQSDR